MKKITIILMIVVFSLLIVGCPSQTEISSRPPIDNPPIGGGCGVSGVDDSTYNNIQPTLNFMDEDRTIE